MSHGLASWWQVTGALVVVFALLIVALKFLGRLSRRVGGGKAGLLAVWPVAPRREIQVVRLHDEVHYLYKADTGLVLLRSEPLASWEAAQPAAAGAGLIRS